MKHPFLSSLHNPEDEPDAAFSLEDFDFESVSEQDDTSPAASAGGGGGNGIDCGGDDR